MAWKGSSTVQRCGLIGESVSLWGWALKSFSQALLSVRVSQLPTVSQSRFKDYQLKHHICLHVIMLPAMMIME